MKVPIQEIIYWILLPLLNFLLWYYFGHIQILSATCESLLLLSSSSSSSSSTSSTSQQSLRQSSSVKSSSSSSSSKSLEDLLQESLEELHKDCEKQHEIEKQQILSSVCQPPQLSRGNPSDSSNKKTTGTGTTVPIMKKSFAHEDPRAFEYFRNEKLASMTVEFLIKTYTDDDTIILIHDKNSGKTTKDCITMDVHTITGYPTSCFAVAYSSTINMTYNIVRIDQDIDIYGLSISNPDPAQVDKYSEPFPLNEYNKGKFYPAGFFRRVPKERGRERVKEKLEPFLIHYQEMNEQFLNKIHSHHLKKGDDLTVMVVNEGELDLFMNFACSCKLHGISLNNILVFAGNP